jgi:hypothetical protein
LKKTSVSSIGTRQRPATKSRSSAITRGHHARAGLRCNRVSSKLRARQEGANDEEASATAPSSALTSLRQLV